MLVSWGGVAHWAFCRNYDGIIINCRNYDGIIMNYRNSWEFWRNSDKTLSYATILTFKFVKMAIINQKVFNESFYLGGSILLLLNT